MKPKVLILDIETTPMEVFVWSLGENYVTLDQVIEETSILSWSAKWLGDPASKIMYQDTRNTKDIRDDSKLIKGMWDLLNEADEIITQNGIRFDEKILNARFNIHGLYMPDSYRHIDILKEGKKHCKFISHKLEYLTDTFCVKYKKLKSKKFPGLSLWKECLDNNPEAWNEMEKYNKHDVLSLEELYTIWVSKGWITGVNYNIYDDSTDFKCAFCGSKKIIENGHSYRETGKFKRYRCAKCKKEVKDRKNVFSKEKRQSLTVPIK